MFERRLASLVLAFEWTIFAVNVFDVNLQFGTGGESGWTLIAVVVLDFEMTLQMLLDVLFLERSQAANVALEALLLQVNSLIMTAQV